MENNIVQDGNKLSSCCHKLGKNKILVAFLGLMIIVAIFMIGLCVGLRAGGRGFGYFGRQGMMQRGEWGYGGKGGFRGQPRGMMGGYGQVPVNQTAPVQSTTTVTAPTAPVVQQ